MSSGPFARELDASMQAKFKETFGLDYNNGKCIITLKQLMDSRPEVSSSAIDKAWGAAQKLKLAGGLYVGRLNQLEKDEAPLLVINGFYAAMRADYIKPGNRVVYFTVEWQVGQKLHIHILCSLDYSFCKLTFFFL